MRRAILVLGLATFIGALSVFGDSNPGTWVHTPCYAPNGVASTDLDFVPCINVYGVHSMCCATNRTTTPSPGNDDTCMPNGLCMDSVATGLFRNLCTDSTWNSPNCVSKTVCNAAAGGSDSGGTVLTQCVVSAGTPDTFCCGADQSCCSGSTTFHLNDLAIFASSSTTSSSTSTATGNSGTTSIVTTTATATTTVSANSKTKMVAQSVAIGLGVGLVAAGLLGALGGFLVGTRRQKKRDGFQMEGVRAAQGWNVEVKAPMLGSDGRVIHEAGEQEHIAELGEQEQR